MGERGGAVLIHKGLCVFVMLCFWLGVRLG